MALRLAIDVNRYSDLCRGDEFTLETIRRASEVFFPFVAVAEIRAGFLGGTHAKQNEARFGEFMRSQRVRTLFADEATIQLYADLVVSLRKTGKPVPTNDLWIAALAIQHDLTLFTRDRHFDNIPRLSRM
ncbi:MAG: type II toxin-antitoxin system VapC family toxin [Planctomycetota bacterium]